MGSGVLLADSDQGPVAVFLAETVLCRSVAHVEQSSDMAVVLDEEPYALAYKCQRAAFELDSSRHWLKSVVKCYCAYLYWFVYYCFRHHTSPGDIFRVKKD